MDGYRILAVVALLLSGFSLGMAVTNLAYILMDVRSKK